MKTLNLALAGTVMAAGVLAAPASAETDQFTFRFAFEPAQLATVDAARNVYAELRTDAHNACRYRAPSAIRSVSTQCREDLVASVVRGIDDPALNRIHDRAASGQDVQMATLR